MSTKSSTGDGLPGWLDRELWTAFVEMRAAKGKRAPFTATARKLVLGKLQRMQASGVDANAALGESVMNGWSGVFEPKLSQGYKSTAPAGPWHQSRSGIEAKGVELGLGRWDEDAFGHGRGEAWPVYQSRVTRKAHAEGCYDTEPARPQ